MRKIFQICAVLAAAFAVTGCYNDFDTPGPAKVYTDSDFSSMKRTTIAEVKQMFLDEFKSLANTGVNGGWNDTKYLQIGQKDGLDLYIKGKVMSSDEEGNVYKSLYLVDETGAIEVKLNSGLYMRYPMGHFDKATGEIPTCYVYVKVTGLYLGNYRMMLSLGNGPTESYNKLGEHKFYANSNIEDKVVIAQHVFAGEPATLKVGEEILVMTKDNYQQYFGEGAQHYLGYPMLLKDVQCIYGNIGTNIYPGWMDRYLEGTTPTTIFKKWYRWAYAYNNTNLYGSVLFTYTGAIPSQSLSAGLYTVRTSGYSQFAMRPIVKDGATGDILAIFGLYSKSWSYGYGAYQLTVNRFEDLMFDKDDFLTKEEVELMTPNGFPAQDGYYYDPYTDPRSKYYGYPDSELKEIYNAAEDSYFAPSTGNDDDDFNDF